MEYMNPSSIGFRWLCFTLTATHYISSCKDFLPSLLRSGWLPIRRCEQRPRVNDPKTERSAQHIHESKCFGTWLFRRLSRLSRDMGKQRIVRSFPPEVSSVACHFLRLWKDDAVYAKGCQDVRADICGDGSTSTTP